MKELDKTYRSRVVDAYSLFIRRQGRIDWAQEELASRCNELMAEHRLEGSISQQSLGAWLKGSKQPREAVHRIAFALLLGVDPGWLYFHPYSAAPAPMDVVTATFDNELPLTLTATATTGPQEPPSAPGAPAKRYPLKPAPGGAAKEDPSRPAKREGVSSSKRSQLRSQRKRRG